MKSLSLGLALLCACFLAGAHVSESYSVARECVLISRGEMSQFNLILVHDGSTLWSRPVYREVLESGEFGTKRLALDAGQWKLLDGDELAPTILGNGPKDDGQNADYDHCMPDETELWVNGSIQGLIFRADRDTLCRPVNHALDTHGETVAFKDVPNYAACVRKIAAEHPEATVVLYRWDIRQCEYKTGTPFDHSDKKYKACDRTLPVKLPGIGITTVSWKAVSAMGVCNKERHSYKYSVEEVIGKTSKPRECFERVAVDHPDAAVAHWDRDTYECLAKKGEHQGGEFSTKVISCKLQLCPNPEVGSVENTSTVKHKKLFSTDSYEECAQQVTGMHPDAVYAVWHDKDHACWACFGGAVTSQAGIFRCPLNLMCPNPDKGSVHTAPGDKKLENMETHEECARRVQEAHPGAIYAVWGPAGEGPRTCYAKYGLGISEDSTRLRCPLKRQQNTVVRNAPRELCPNPEEGSVRAEGGHYRLHPTDSYEECAQQVNDMYPDSTYAVWGPEKEGPRDCFAKLGATAHEAAGYMRCPLKVMMCPNPEVGSVDVNGGQFKMDDTDSYEECAHLVSDSYPDARYAVWGPAKNGPRQCYAKLGPTTNPTAGYVRCPLRVSMCPYPEEGSVHGDGGHFKLIDTETYDNCAQKVYGSHPDAKYAVWGPQKQCYAKLGDGIHDASGLTRCPLKLNNLQPAVDHEPWSKIVLGEFGNVIECAKHAARAYPDASAVMLDANKMCTLRLELDVTVQKVTSGEDSSRLDFVVRRGLLENRSATHIDVGNAESLDECARIVRVVRSVSNGVSYEKDTKACYAVTNMIASDSTSYTVNSKWQSAMLPATTVDIVNPLDYSLPENINLELFYAQELTTAYCGEVTCPYHANKEAQLAKQESLKREIDPLFKQLSEEYASFKVGYLEFADKPVFPLGQPNKDWCYRFLNSMTPYDDAYKAWVGDHWKRTWGNPPSGSDYVENQLDAAIAAVMRGDFSKGQFDAQGKLNLRVLFMVTDKGFHVSGDAAGVCSGANGLCKDYFPSDEQCQCAQFEYPSVEQAVDVLAEGKVNTLFYIGEKSDNVYNVYNSVNIKLSEEDPSLLGVTVMASEAGVHEFSPVLFRSGLNALAGAQAQIWTDRS